MSALNNLILAASDGRMEEIKRLIGTKGVSLETQDQNGDTALCWACWKGEQEAVEYLIEKNANVNHANRFDDTPLTQAALQGFSSIVEILIENKAEIEHIRGNGDTALSLSAFRGHSEVLKLLLSKDADVNHEDKYGNTSYEWTQHYKYDDCSALLDIHGAKKFDSHTV